jgi:hypothetical protein
MNSTPRSTRRHALFVVLATCLAAGSLSATSPAGPALDGFQRFVHENGSFRFSRASTEGLVHLGSWFVPAGDAAGFHHVYTQPEAIAVYRETGRFPDGTALVKEIVSDRRASYTTGADVASATTTRQWFLMVKDAAGRFDGNPLWGEGWGWALFKSDDPTQNVATDYRGDCLGCHTPARSTDWVYTEGYPSLGRR